MDTVLSLVERATPSAVPISPGVTLLSGMVIFLFLSYPTLFPPGDNTIVSRGDDCSNQQQLRLLSSYVFLLHHCIYYKTCRLPHWVSFVQKVRKCISHSMTNSDSNRTWRAFHPNSAWAFFSILDRFSLASHYAEKYNGLTVVMTGWHPRCSKTSYSIQGQSPKPQRE